MGTYVSRITYNGREIIFMNSANKGEEEGIAAWAEMKEQLLKEHGPCLVLVDGTGIKMAPGSVNKAKEAAAVMKQDPASRIAFVGLSGLQKSTAQLLAKGYGMNVYFAKGLDEAMKWLTIG